MLKQKAIICDIDGCLLDTKQVLKDAQESTSTTAEKWAYFDRHANDRACVVFNYELAYILNSLSLAGYKIILSTARSESIRQSTLHRLVSEMPMKNVRLFMRPAGDMNEAAQVKENHLKEILNYYDPQIAIDDEDANLQMFQKYGLLVLKMDFNPKLQKKGVKLW